MAEEDDKEFPFFLNFPPEMRMMVVDKMEPDDRCRFSGCSKLSNSEAKNSKNYIFGLSIKFNDFLQVGVFYNNCRISKTTPLGYCLFFQEDEADGKYVECLNPNGDTLWKTNVDSENDMVSIGVVHFINMLLRYQNTIKLLSLQIGFRKHNFGIERMNHLEYLELDGYTDIEQIRSKMKRPFKNVRIEGIESDKLIAEYEQEIYQVQECLIVPNLKLNYEQFQKISSPFIDIHIGFLTEIDIFNFIKSWQNGKIEKDINFYQWNMYESNFDVQQLLELLGSPSHDLTLDTLAIKHHKDAGKIGHIVCYIPQGGPLIFQVIST